MLHLSSRFYCLSVPPVSADNARVPFTCLVYRKLTIHAPVPCVYLFNLVVLKSYYKLILILLTLLFCLMSILFIIFAPEIVPNNNLKLLFMEVRIYNNASDFAARKFVLVKRVECCSEILFPFDSSIRTFKSMYGDSCIIEFVVL